MKKAVFVITFLLNVCNISAQWTQMNGPFGGRINCIITNGTSMFAGSDNGVFVSSDLCSNWTNKSSGLSNKNILSLTASGNKIYAGTDSGLYVSDNMGDLWVSISNGIESKKVLSIAVSPSGRILAGTNWGLYISDDNGISWTGQYSPTPSGNSIYSISIKDTMIYLGSHYTTLPITCGGIFVSSDNGNSWTSSNNGMSRSAICFSFINDKILAGTNGGGIFISTNNGTNWSSINNGLPNSGYIYVNSIKNIGDTIYTGTNYGVYKSFDYGINWVEENSGFASKNILSLETIGSTLIAGTDLNGVYISVDFGNEWITSSNGINAVTVNSISIDDSLIYAGTISGIFICNKDIGTWSLQNEGLSLTDIKAIGNNDSIIIAGVSSGTVISTKGNINWTSTGCTTQPKSFAFINNKIYAAGTMGISLTENNGNSWVTVNNGITNPYINSIATDSVNIFVGATLYASAGIFSGTIFRSVDNGNTWTNVSCGYDTIVKSVALNNDKLYAGMKKYGVSISSDNGDSWHHSNDITIQDNPISDFAFHDTIVFISTEKNGIYMSNDYGDTWLPINTGLNPTKILSLESSSGFLYAGSEKEGVWKISIFELLYSKILNTDNFLIYPNPANDKLNIDIDEKATLEIINSQGQIVDSKSLTEKSNNLDISNLSSGVYTLRIKTDSGIAIRKLIKQ